MPGVLIDTAGWGHLVDKSQLHHSEAARLYRAARETRQRLVTTNYNLSELVALLTSPLHTPRPQLIAIVAGIKTSPFVEIVHIDQALDAEAWQLLAERPDKAWSLVDCSSFVLMQRLHITDSLTTDTHFAQAGFRALLRTQ